MNGRPNTTDGILSCGTLKAPVSIIGGEQLLHNVGRVRLVPDASEHLPFTPELTLGANSTFKRLQLGGCAATFTRHQEVAVSGPCSRSQRSRGVWRAVCDPLGQSGPGNKRP